jgi:internalin A
MKKIIFTVSLVLSLMPIAVKAQIQDGMSFGAWCEQRNLIKLETAHTINVVLNLLGTNDCRTANSLLKERRELNLNKSEIIDLRPLAGLVNLLILNIDDNNISDIKPLVSLSNLEDLSIKNNNISDIPTLNKLKKLKALDLSENKISNVSGLKDLNELQELNLSANQITSLLPIVTSVSLRKLNFSNNSIENISKVDGLENLISSSIKVETNNYSIKKSSSVLPTSSLNEKNSSYILPIQLLIMYIGLLVFLYIVFLRKSKNNKQYSSQLLDTPVFHESSNDKVFSDIFAAHSFYKKDWLAAGEAMYNLLAYKFAVEAFDRYLAIDPENFAVWKKRGKALAGLNQYDDAIKSYQSALKIKDASEYDDAYEAWLEVLRLDDLEEIYELKSFLNCQDSLQFLEQN